MEKTNNVIEKEFSTIGLIEQSLDGPYEKYLINFNLNTSIKSIQIGVVDANAESPTSSPFTSAEPFFNKRTLIEIHNLYECTHKFLIFANVTGKYVVDLNNPDKDHIEIEKVSVIDSEKGSILSNQNVYITIGRPNTYTGLITSIERQEDFIIVTLDTTNIKFKCPVDSFKSINLSKPISISVYELIDTCPPGSRYFHNVYTVKQV